MINPQRSVLSHCNVDVIMLDINNTNTSLTYNILITNSKKSYVYNADKFCPFAVVNCIKMCPIRGFCIVSLICNVLISKASLYNIIVVYLIMISLLFSSF